jgi:hypothetical protein
VKALLAAGIVLLTASPAAAEDLLFVTSEVYQTPGSQSEIARRGQQCIAKNLHATDAAVILSADMDAGVVVARNALEYGAFPRWKIRSTFTLEAKEGRFRIVQTNLERYLDQAMWGGLVRSPESLGIGLERRGAGLRKVRHGCGAMRNEAFRERRLVERRGERL